MEGKSLLTVINDDYQMITGRPYFLGREWQVERRQWRYRFADGDDRVTYVGALLQMRREMARVASAPGGE